MSDTPCGLRLQARRPKTTSGFSALTKTHRKQSHAPHAPHIARARALALSLLNCFFFYGYSRFFCFILLPCPQLSRIQHARTEVPGLVLFSLSCFLLSFFSGQNTHLLETVIHMLVSASPTGLPFFPPTKPFLFFSHSFSFPFTKPKSKAAICRDDRRVTDIPVRSR